ncbi:hypothetical protein [Kribbella sp. VKM Ac-2571]|uniref:hypothetical protein n=1 Tax=Kribbella sp. VKM Ac-2571 TaxID=2512222 RepID=UPI001EDD5B33|nr:hypothetical protein [Kribbella sp. VKM Ac-2571]
MTRLPAELSGCYARGFRGCAHSEVVLNTSREQCEPTAGHQQVCMRPEADRATEQAADVLEPLVSLLTEF